MKQISSRMSIAVHMLSLMAASGDAGCTSDFMAASVGTNPVVIRRMTGQLKKAGLVRVRPGVGGATVAKPPESVTLLDVYRAVQAADDGPLFHFHSNPNPDCPVGRGIETALRGELLEAQAAMERRLAGTTLADIGARLAR